MFSSLSFNQRPRRFWNDRADPDFNPGNAASLTNHGRNPALAPEVSTPSRRIDAAGRPVGILLFPVSVGLIAAAIIGVFFGIGFWLLASPARKTIGDSGRDPSRLNDNALKASGAAVVEFAGEMEILPSAAAKSHSGLALDQGPAAADVAPPQQNNVTQELSPAPPSGEPPVETTSVRQSVSSAAVSPAYLMPLPSSPAVAAPDGALSAGTKAPSAHDGRSAHARTVSRHSRPHSARGAPTLTPPRSLLAQTITPPQTSSSGQTRTRGQTEPADQALTPPRVDQPDPFAQRVWNK
jgi:hypothetical protein